jgi:hypothetical protein
LSTVTVTPALATAATAANVARGSSARRAASPTAPTAAISGHFTHHADASRKTTVSGCQRSDSANEEAALSQPRSDWNSSVTSSTIAAEAPGGRFGRRDVEQS